MASLALTALALTLPPHAVVVPGKSFAGLQLGATPAQVRAGWGTRFGRCRGCPRPTWYFTYKKFEPRGAGVEFRNGHASAFFTLWSPRGWRTSDGLRVGDPAPRIAQLYGVLPRVECGSYASLVLRHRNVDTLIYVVDEKVWGFGLSSVGVPACR